MQEAHGLGEVFLRLSGHGVDGDAALLDGEGRVLDEALLEADRLVRGLGLDGLVLDQQIDDLFDDVDERQKNDDLDEAEERVDKGDGDARHRHAHEIKLYEGIDEVERRRPEDDTHDLDHEVDHSRALAVDIRADGDAHDDRQGHRKIDDARGGQRLQNADGGRCALQHAGEQRAEEDTEHGIGERGEDAQKCGVAPQRGDSPGHGAHAEHQHGKAHQDVADVALRLTFGEHAQHDADHRDDAGQRGRGEQVDPAAASAKVGKADDPAGDGRAEDGAHDDGDGLAHPHHAGVHKADHHDRRRRRRLNDRRHARAE